MIPLLEDGARIINVDESWLNSTRFLRRIWAPAEASATFTDKQVLPRISLILALDTNGKMWAALTQVNTDTNVMTLFLQYLKRQLDREDAAWKEKTYILLDNAKWHTNPEMKQRLARMELPIIFSAPYCYTTAPAESAFSALKLGELNPEHLPTGKKSLSHLADMVGSRLAEIPRSVVISYWHRAVLNLYGYLYYERL